MVMKRSRASTNLRRRVRRRYAPKRKMRISRALSVNTVMLKRKTWAGNWQPSTATTADFWKYYGYNLAQVSGYQDITNMFDEYRICALKYEFHPRFSGFNGNDTTDTTLPGVTNQSGTKLHIIVDKKSTLTPTGTYTSSTFNTLMENGDVRTYSGNRIIKVYVSRPTIGEVLTGGATVQQFKEAPWLRTDNGIVQHFGFHAFAQDNNFNGSFGQSWDIFVTAYVMARNLR